MATGAGAGTGADSQTLEAQGGSWLGSVVKSAFTGPLGFINEFPSASPQQDAGVAVKGAPVGMRIILPAKKGK